MCPSLNKNVFFLLQIIPNGHIDPRQRSRLKAFGATKTWDLAAVDTA